MIFSLILLIITLCGIIEWGLFGLIWGFYLLGSTEIREAKRRKKYDNYSKM